MRPNPVSYGWGHAYWRDTKWKTSFLVLQAVIPLPGFTWKKIVSKTCYYQSLQQAIQIKLIVQPDLQTTNMLEFSTSSQLLKETVQAVSKNKKLALTLKQQYLQEQD